MLFCVMSFSMLYAQVGINTASPQGVLHIKPLTGTSDVIVSSASGKEGNVGVGTVTPDRKLEIRTTSAVKALRLADTSQGAGKVLMSDAQAGVATWREKQGSWFGALLYGEVTPTTSSLVGHPVQYSSSFISDLSLGQVDQSTGAITVPYKGMYRVSLFGSSIMLASRYSGGYFIAGYLRVIVNNPANTIWAPHCLGNTALSSMQYFSYSRLIYLQPSDRIRIETINIIPRYADGLSNFSFYVELLKTM